MEKKQSSLSRRDFAKTSAAAGFAILASRSGRAQESAETLKIGLIGAGGRGCGAAVNCLTGNENVKLVALADVFEESVIKAKVNLERNNDPRVKDKLAIEDELCFSGLDAYQKLLETDVDIVIHATPPYCRPMHLEAIVEAGKHLFSEKPFAVDSPGIRRCLAAAKVADEKGLTFVTGLQRRYQDKYIGTVKKLQDGAIGKILYGRAYWNGSLPFSHDREAGESDLAYRLRNWYNQIWTCGDSIVEQHVHNIDVINWVLDEYPTKVVANGGRAWKPAEEKYGDIWDNFACDYEYASGARMLSMSRHWNNSKSDVWERVVGTEKESTCGEMGRDRSDPYVNEHIAMLESIRGDRERINDGERTAYATLTAIMGREAAYTGQEVTWEQALNCEKSLVPADLDFEKEYPVGSIPVPGSE